MLDLHMLTMDSPLERKVSKRTKHLEMKRTSVALPAFGSEDWNTKSMCNDFTVIERYAPWSLSGDVGMGGSGGITNNALLQVLSNEENATGSDTVSGNGGTGFHKETYIALEFSEEFEDQSRQTQSPETNITSTETPPASGSAPVLAPRHSNPSLPGLPLEILRFIVDDLDAVSQTCLKFTNSYFHSMINQKCLGPLNFRRRQALISCLERDVGPYRALLQCSNCKEFRLRMLIPGRAPNRRWTPSRLSFREEIRSCCKTLVPPGTTALRISQSGVSSQELKGAECVIDVDEPGMALILVCLHCSAEMVYTGEDVDKQRCTLCGCGFCPLGFMPRRLSVSLVDV